ncbi:hypothetical protein JCM12298_29520 [Desulfothermus naphthae]
MVKESLKNIKEPLSNTIIKDRVERIEETFFAHFLQWSVRETDHTHRSQTLGNLFNF